MIQYYNVLFIVSEQYVSKDREIICYRITLMKSLQILISMTYGSACLYLSGQSSQHLTVSIPKWHLYVISELGLQGIFLDASNTTNNSLGERSGMQHFVVCFMYIAICYL